MRTWQVLVLVAGFLVAGGASRAVRADEAQPPPQPWEQAGTQPGQEITGPDGGKMVWVPAGEFMMGWDEFDSMKPVHKVHITKGFWVGKCTVTNAQYRRYCAEAGVDFPEESDGGDSHPVVFIGWDDAVAYCKHYGLSLPTEAQREYVAAGPESRKYPWGNDWDQAKCCNKNHRGPGGKTFPVGSFPEGASWCGALDMAGNVCEWCQDWYDDKYYAHSPADDPPGPDTGTCRVLRGGSWLSGSRDCFRCACRYSLDPRFRLKYYGFRCARTP